MNEMSFEERLLERVGASMAYPATPQLRGRVVSAIASPTPRRMGPEMRRPLVLGLAAAAAVIIAVVLGVPASRTAVAKFFHIQGSKIERLPTARPGETPTPFPTPVGLESEAKTNPYDLGASRRKLLALASVLAIITECANSLGCWLLSSTIGTRIFDSIGT